MKLGDITFEEKERAQTNSLVLGSIGFGKSKFLEYLMRQDLERRQPFCLIDMHGKTFREIKKWCAYNAYLSRSIVLIDPAEGNYVKPYNPFRKKEGVDTTVQTSGMVQAVLKASGITDDTTFAVIYKLVKILFTVVVSKQTTIMEAFTLLGKRDALNQIVKELDDPLIDSLWSDLANLSPSEWSRSVTPTSTRLFNIIHSKPIQRFMGVQAPSLQLNFTDTILVNLAPGGLLDARASRVFAALLLNDLYQSAFSRKGKLGKDPSPYYVYVDEWWLVPTQDFGRILAETRKFGLLLCLSNQDLSQIREIFGGNFAQSILTLCQLQCCFGGINDDDAGRLSREWNLAADSVRGLAERQCLVKLPRRIAQAITVPEVSSPFVSDERILQFERRIAEKNGALPLDDIDKMLARPQKKEISTFEDTDEGYAVQRRRVDRRSK